jgi:GT2 family glycosyltransferase
MKIGFVCTNYNNTKFTRDAVRSLIANRNHDIKIVIVDNNSDTQNIAELLDIQVEFPGIKVIFNEENSGYFKGLNIGIRYLLDNHSPIDFMAVGNNDLTFSENFVDSIQARIDVFENYPVVCPDVVTVDGVHQNPHVIQRVGKIREFIYDLYFANYYLGLAIKWLARLTNLVTDRSDEESWETAQTIYQGHGSCYLLGPLFFLNFKELWAPTFLMGEEFFLSKQVTDAGMQIYYEPGITLTHHWHATMDALPNRKIWEISRQSHKIYRKYVKIINR